MLILLGPTEVITVVELFAYIAISYSVMFIHCISYLSLCCYLLIHHIIIFGLFSWHCEPVRERLERLMTEWGRGPDCKDIDTIASELSVQHVSYPWRFWYWYYGTWVVRADYSVWAEGAPPESPHTPSERGWLYWGMDLPWTWILS